MAIIDLVNKMREEGLIKEPKSEMQLLKENVFKLRSNNRIVGLRINRMYSDYYCVDNDATLGSFESYKPDYLDISLSDISLKSDKLFVKKILKELVTLDLVMFNNKLCTEDEIRNSGFISEYQYDDFRERYSGACITHIRRHIQKSQEVV